MEKEMSNINALFEQDAGALQVKNEDLDGIGALARRAKLLEKEIEEFESVLNERKEQRRKLLEETIPAMLEELGMNAWPAFQTLHFDGWVLRFADGASHRPGPC